MSSEFPVDLNITRVAKHTKDAWSFFTSASPRPTFKAGQVAVLQVNEHSGYIAFASAPEDNEFEFLVKSSERPSLANLLFDPDLIKYITLKDVVGSGFVIEDHRGSDLVFVAMGTGLAPLRSVLRHTFHARQDYGRLVVLYGVRTIDDFCFVEEMAADWRSHGVELKQVISQPQSTQLSGEWSGPTGYVQSLLDHVVPKLQRPVALVCGSQKMMEQTRLRLIELGFDTNKILTNY